MTDFLRQLDLLDPAKIRYPVVILGAGGIGSWAALTLAKMGIPRLTVWDPDIVESHNCPNQCFRHSDIDRPKVEALREIIRDFTGTEIEVKQEVYDGQESLSGLVICGVDLLETRSAIWKHIRDQVPIPLFIDARMAGETGAIYSLNPTDPRHIDEYEKTLYSDDVADERACTAQAIAYNLMVIAGEIGLQVKSFLTHKSFPNYVAFSLPLNQWIFVNF